MKKGAARILAASLVVLMSSFPVCTMAAPDSYNASDNTYTVQAFELQNSIRKMRELGVVRQELSLCETKSDYYRNGLEKCSNDLVSQEGKIEIVVKNDEALGKKIALMEKEAGMSRFLYFTAGVIVASLSIWLGGSLR